MNSFFSHTITCDKNQRSTLKIFNLKSSFILMAFLFIFIRSEAFLNFQFSMSLSEEIKYSYVRKCSLTSRPKVECANTESSFLAVVHLSWKIFSINSSRIFLTMANTSLSSFVVISCISLCFNVIKPPFFQESGCVTRKDAPQTY